MSTHFSAALVPQFVNLREMGPPCYQASALALVNIFDDLQKLSGNICAHHSPPKSFRDGTLGRAEHRHSPSVHSFSGGSFGARATARFTSLANKKWRNGRAPATLPLGLECDQDNLIFAEV